MYLTNCDKWQEVEEEFFASIDEAIREGESSRWSAIETICARLVFRFMAQHFEPPERKMQPEASF